MIINKTTANKKIINRQSSGFTLIELMLVLTIISGLAATYGPQLIQQQQPMSQAEEAKNDIAEIKSAANGYYMENRAWPASVNELINTGYYTGSGISPFGTNYSIGTNGNNLEVSIDTNRKMLANMLVGKVSFGHIGTDGKTVVTKMGTPSREAIQSFFLARNAIPGCPDCNQLAAGTNIDMNNNDLNNVNEIDVDQAIITNATITTANIDKVEAESIHFGNNSITSVGNQLNINADTLRINANLSMNGNIEGNGNDIIDFDRLEANVVDVSELIATTGNVTDLSGTTLTYSNGIIDVLSGNSLNYVNGTINSLSGDTLSFNAGAISSLSGTTLNYGSGSIDNLSGNTLDYASATVNILSGKTLNYTTVNGTNGIFNNLLANKANIGNLGVKGTATLNKLTADNGTLVSLISSNADFNEVSFDSLDADDLVASNANLATVNATTIMTDFLTTGTFSANSVNITGDFSVGGTLKGNNVIVSNKTITNKLQASSSELGSAIANDIKVSGNITTKSASANSMNANSATIKNLSGTNADFNTVTANQVDGGVFNGSNFITSQSSVNNNKSLINDYISKWNDCKNAGGCQ